jgi:type VI secretion system protein ImpE
MSCSTVTPQAILAGGGLKYVLAERQAATASTSSDNQTQVLLVELLAAMGRYEEAIQQLQYIPCETTQWPELERELYRVLLASRRRSEDFVKPRMMPEPAPLHAQHRWSIIKAIRQGRPKRAVRASDAAEVLSPVMRGFVNGREFEGLRDADDRFASVLEVFLGGEYYWFAWEAIRKLTLQNPIRLLDYLIRPAMITMTSGAEYRVHLPLVYPASQFAEDEFALGLETDFLCPDGGPMRCVGGKLLMIGDDTEFPLAECRMLELKSTNQF